MNVFVLCPGRCGSKTFVKACSHITNWTSGHETRVNPTKRLSLNDEYKTEALNYNRVNYPDNHIEVDCRLTWFLGFLDEVYEDTALYVNLTRNRAPCAMSWSERWGNPVNILWWWVKDIHQNHEYLLDQDTRERAKRVMQFALEYVDATDALIRMFLKDKTNTMSFPIEDAADLFPVFWERIGAKGNIKKALKVFNRTTKRQRQLSPRQYLNDWEDKFINKSSI